MKRIENFLIGSVASDFLVASRAVSIDLVGSPVAKLSTFRVRQAGWENLSC
jgi:hypothetical protein